MRRFVAFVEQFFTALFRYGRREQRGIVLLLALATAGLLGVMLRPGRGPDTAWLAVVDRRSDSLRVAYYRRYDSLPDRRPTTVARPARPRQQPVYIELNTADSARLTTVRGIGPVISRNIVAYRRRLGGFAQKEQLREVWGITDENFDAIAAQFYLDTAVIQKINLNFASPDLLRAHPCFTASMVERILRARAALESAGETKGGWTTLKELTDNDILLPHEAKGIAAYVVF